MIRWAPFLLLALLLVAAPARADHVPPEEIHDVLPRDAIPAVRTPEFAERNYLSPNQQVIGVEIDGDARAYPIQILNWHEVVNDVVGGVPVAVTFCPLCHSALLFDRRVGDETLIFGVSGKLYRSNLVMYDEQTESLWNQILGEAIQGPLHGTQLEVLESTVVEWGTWKDIHPDSLLLDYPLPPCDGSLSDEPQIIEECRDYSSNPYAGYLLTEDVFFGGNNSDRLLHPKAVVLGVEIGGVAMAYPYENLSRDLVVNDVVNGVELVVAFHDGSAKAFRRDGLTFQAAEDRFMVDDRGGQWDRVTGEGADGQLEEVPSMMNFWFSWSQFHKETGVHGLRDPVTSDRTFGLETVYIPLVVAFLAATVYYGYRREGFGDEGRK